ncbi:MAG: phage portal protein [Thermomicrobiales bacterium]
MIPQTTADAIPAWPSGILTAADRARFARYAEAIAFVDGAQWLGRQRRGETRLTFNYARVMVRKTAAYVFPAPVTFTIPAAGDETVANAAERILAECGAVLDLGRLDVDLCIEAATLGDAAVKVTWDAARGRPEVAPVDPATLAVMTAPDNPRRMRRLTQVYALAERDAVALFSLHGSRTATERPVTVAETWSEERWRVEVAGQVVRDDINPYGWIPYVMLANGARPGEFWGESDLTDLYDPCRELNARLSTLSRVLDVSGAPIAVLENVDGSEGISVGPGAKWELPEGARAYLLDLLSGGGVGLHVQYIDLLFRVLHDLSETPRTAFGDSGRDLSGAALEVEVQPLVQKVARKRRDLDAFYRERNARLLDLLERFGGEALGGLRRTVTVWPSPLPSDLDAAVRNAARLVAGGIHSRRTAVATLGGDDPEGEWRRVLEEARELEGAPASPRGVKGERGNGGIGGRDERRSEGAMSDGQLPTPDC